ncbi:hypothetical protein MKP08_07035 [Erythrobacter sp. LQ02-29]|uniref:hypothetical protein n=1 Tax=unclassified Erythrobacter TaxID=2633097 RepID=UPI001BFC3255|nr:MULTISPECIES: hypothetical protein [unclassified Erythrobacter]MCP9222498.1 hypothetical protein [Erythrobacter sp. LQ02-29]QWC56217.1 hypothetical protein F7D01_03140 [Erythrobacter sp. 3-20A1M]
MKTRILTAAATALALVSVPTMAQAEVSRDAAPVEGESNLAGGSGVIIGILAVAAIIAGIVVAADSDDEEPISF